MKNSNITKTTLIAVIVLLITGFTTTVKEDIKIPEVTKHDGIYYLTIDGKTPFAKGYQHGVALKEVIQKSMIDFDTWVISNSDYKNSKEMATDFIQKTNYLQDVKTYTPDLYSELIGMAEGSDVDLKTLFLYNSFDEYIAFLMEQKPSIEQIAHCTTTGVFGRTDKPNFVTHNNDLMLIFSNKVVVSKIIDTEKNVEIMQTSFAGIFAQNGLNNYGVAVGCNILVDLERNHNGLPVAFNNRKILETKNIQEAKKYLQSVPSAQAMNYMIGDRNKVISFEVTGNGNVHNVTNFQEGYTVHTNHTLNKNAKKVRDITSSQPSIAKTVERLEKAASVLAENHKTITTQGIKDLKSTKPIRINEEGSITQTIESVIMEIPKTGKPVLYVTNGLPNGDNYVKFEF